MTKKAINRAPPYVYHPENGLSKEILRVTVPSPIPADLFDEPRSSQRGWKSINSQYCVVCKEGGNILCCDNCPASFHLMCHQPIIFPDEIPEGKWLCNRCKNTPTDKRTPRQAIENNVDVDSYEMKKNLEAAQHALGSEDQSSNPLALLVDAAKCQNASLFELPPELEPDPIVMPGDPRSPRPELKEVQCDSCKETDIRTMAQCDFCPSKYHLDCLNPPLVGIPKDKWMCPNHVETIVDQKLLKSLSIVTRRQLWKRHARQNINEPAIYKSFLRKIRKRRKVQKPQTDGAVPMSICAVVKGIYKQKWSPGDPRATFRTQKERDDFVEKMVDDSATTLDLALRRKLKKRAKMEEAIKEGTPLSSKNSEGNLPPLTENASDLKLEVISIKSTPERTLPPSVSSTAVPSTSDITSNSTTLAPAISKSRLINSTDNSVSEVVSNICASVSSTASLSVSSVASSSNSSSIETRKRVATNRPPEEKSIEKGDLKKCPKSILAECVSRFKSCNDPAEKKILSLAIERLQQLVKQTVVPTVTKPKLKGFHPHCFVKNLPILAVFKAEGSEFPHAIQRAVTNVGISKDCHICLLDVSSNVCSMLLPHHASIVFDKILRRFELQPNMNSRVFVDGIAYGAEKETSNLHCSCSGSTQAAASQTAPLRNGSYVVIGCLNFVFASFY